MEFLKCQRCWTQKALFRCPSCEKNQILCNKCDTYIHSMNQYKLHQRYGLSESYKNISLNPSYINQNRKEIRKPRPKSKKINDNKINNVYHYKNNNIKNYNLKNNDNSYDNIYSKSENNRIGV